MSKTLYIMCGPAGIGKSTFIAEEILHSNNSYSHISRDAIRYFLVSENESYFSREKEVYQQFIQKLQKEINDTDVDCVYADATHLTPKSREKLLDNLNIKDVEIIPIFFDLPLKEIFKRNDLRSGRKHIPKKVIKKMYNSYIFPTFGENKYKYSAIRRINRDGTESLLKEDGAIEFISRVYTN